MIFVGLGNPTEELKGSRHNIGREFLMWYGERADGEMSWKAEKISKALVAKVKTGAKLSVFVLPETYMNNSGLSLRNFVSSKKDLEKLVVLHDDLDLPLGTIKISFNRGDGGHNGVKSVISHLKSNTFTRVRIGIAKKSARGVALKPKGEDKVVKYVLGKFSPAEKLLLKKVYKKLSEAIEVLSEEGREIAMNRFN